MYHMGILTALGIAIHNLPEGLAVFSSAVAGNVQLGILVAIAVALHNIPEGIIVFIPINEATGNAKMAFLASMSSGLAEPLGALIGYAILAPFLSPAVMASMLAFAAGIMVYISLDELLPASREYGSAHLTMVGIGFGMLIMALSFILMGQ
jgi:ZIP family zinc transporter